LPSSNFQRKHFFGTKRNYIMNRRGFFTNIFRAAAAVVLPTVLLNYDPVKQAIVQPKKIGDMYLYGYKGSAFLETGYVYSPYIPLVQTSLIYNPEHFK
jgi:hypothetical protein